MKKRLLYEDVKNFIEIESQSGCKLVSTEYTGSKINLQIACSCNDDYFTSFNRFKDANQRMCKKCRKKINSQNLRKTNEQFVSQVYSLVKDEYKIISEYINYHTHVQMKHTDCEFEYPVTPANFISGGYRCPNCFGSKQSNTEEFKLKVLNQYGNEYEVIGEYINNRTKIKMKHNVCNYEYSASPNDILAGNKCWKCSGLERKTIDTVKKDVFNMVGDEYIVDGEYISNKTKIFFTHKTCGVTFPMNTNNFLNGQRCPICAESKGEQAVRRYFEVNNIDYIPQKEYLGLVGLNNGNLSYDFHLREYNLLIEFQGIQHEEYRRGWHKDNNAFKQQQEHDKRKKEYANKNNINLLEIWYYDIDNIEQILDKELNNYKKCTIL